MNLAVLLRVGFEELENVTIVTMVLREYISILDRKYVVDCLTLLREEEESIHRLNP